MTFLALRTGNNQAIQKGFTIVKVKRHRYVPDLYVVTRIVVPVYSLLTSLNVAEALMKVYSLFKT